MYDKRVRIFVILTTALLLACILRLAQMQLLPGSSVQDQIARLRQQGNSARQLKTVRGRILDRNGKVLATDEARFELCIDYKLSSILDENVRKAALLKAQRQSEQDPTNTALPDASKKIEAKLDDLQQIIDKCTRLGGDRETIEAKIRRTNEEIWICGPFWRGGETTPTLR